MPSQNDDKKGPPTQRAHPPPKKRNLAYYMWGNKMPASLTYDIFWVPYDIRYILSLIWYILSLIWYILSLIWYFFESHMIYIVFDSHIYFESHIIYIVFWVSYDIQYFVFWVSYDIFAHNVGPLELNLKRPTDMNFFVAPPSPRWIWNILTPLKNGMPPERKFWTLPKLGVLGLDSIRKTIFPGALGPKMIGRLQHFWKILLKTSKSVVKMV